MELGTTVTIIIAAVSGIGGSLVMAATYTLLQKWRFRRDAKRNSTQGLSDVVVQKIQSDEHTKQQLYEWMQEQKELADESKRRADEAERCLRELRDDYEKLRREHESCQRRVERLEAQVRELQNTLIHDYGREVELQGDGQ